MPAKESVLTSTGAAPAQLYRPDASGKHPAVIIAPGGTQQGEIPAYDWIASRLAGAGYFALTVTYRSKNSIDDTQDIEAGRAWLEAQADVDHSRVSIFGHSRGGLSALRAAAENHRLRSVVSFAAPTDIPRYVRSVESFAPSRYRDIIEWIGGTQDELPERYALLRGLSYADRIRQPVLLVQGTLDMVTPLDHALWMELALKDAGNSNVRVEMIPRMGHFCEQTGQGYLFDRVAASAIQWFAENSR